MTREEIFWSKIDRSGDCWFWLSYHAGNDRPYTSKDGGSGIELVYRKIYRELCDPALTSETSLHHTCGNGRCVNPGHLEPISRADHARLHAILPTHCPQGHPYTGANLYVRPNGHRVCRTCGSLRARLIYARKTGRTLEQVRQQRRKY